MPYYYYEYYYGDDNCMTHCITMLSPQDVQKDAPRIQPMLLLSRPPPMPLFGDDEKVNDATDAAQTSTEPEPEPRRFCRAAVLKSKAM